MALCLRLVEVFTPSAYPDGRRLFSFGCGYAALGPSVPIGGVISCISSFILRVLCASAVNPDLIARVRSGKIRARRLEPYDGEEHDLYLVRQ
jgi:hypothetical protein